MEEKGSDRTGKVWNGKDRKCEAREGPKNPSFLIPPSWRKNPKVSPSSMTVY